jgi:hypothetical protein
MHDEEKNVGHSDISAGRSTLTPVSKKLIGSRYLRFNLSFQEASPIEAARITIQR